MEISHEFYEKWLIFKDIILKIYGGEKMDMFREYEKQKKYRISCLDCGTNWVSDNKPEKCLCGKKNLVIITQE